MSKRPVYLQDLAAGQRVHHWKFGHGQVLTASRVDGKERARVDFGPRGVVDLAVTLARLTDPAAAPADRLRAPWEDLVDESLPLQPLGREPWLAWFGGAVVADDAAFRGALNEINKDVGVYPVGRFGGADVGWPEVTVLIHPAPAGHAGMVRAGVVSIHAPAGQRPFFALPFYSDWNHVHEVTPHRIRVCAGKVEALVEADLHLGDATFPIAFSLPTFDLGRVFLHRGTRVAVALTAMAFVCRPSPSRTFQVRHERAMVDALRHRDFDLGSEPDGTTTYSTEGMSVWLPNTERPDIVEFRGRVVAAQRISLPPRQRNAWKLQLRAWNGRGADWLLDVVFDASVWAAGGEPSVGSEVEGFVWLLGECLGPAGPGNASQNS